jgi:prophage tail gpP-like protein
MLGLARGLGGPAAIGTRRVQLAVGGDAFDLWTRMEVNRSLGELSSSFQLEMRDPPRNIATFPWSTPGTGGPIKFGEPADILLDGEPVLKGWIEDVHPHIHEQRVTLYVSGRDVLCDPVDCHPDPRGKHEYRNIDLAEFCRRVLAKWPHITVRAEVDVGAKFDRMVVDTGETAMSAIEKYARRRAVLVVSDGVGGLLLTRSGKSRAGGVIEMPGNAISLAGNFSARERFSDYFVKGGTEKSGGRGKTPALDAEAEPLDSPREAEGDQSGETHAEAAGSLIMGHASDPEVTRWRPHIAMSRTSTSNTDAQAYADWLMRTRRGKAEQADYELPDWRADSGALWRLNEIVPVIDSYSLLQRDMLMHRICYQYSDRGERTKAGICGPEAYDKIAEGERGKARGGGRGKAGKTGGGTALDSTANPL